MVIERLLSRRTIKLIRQHDRLHIYLKCAGSYATASHDFAIIISFRLKLEYHCSSKLTGSRMQQKAKAKKHVKIGPFNLIIDF